jgi:hypothetical protein
MMLHFGKKDKIPERRQRLSAEAPAMQRALKPGKKPTLSADIHIEVCPAA